MQNAAQTARDLLKLLRAQGCTEVRWKGSHIRIRSGPCFTTIPAHKGENLGKGLLARIQRDLELSLGRGWLTRSL